MTTISGGIFNFTDDSYGAPTWSGSLDVGFGAGFINVRQVYTNGMYSFVVTPEGLGIFNTADMLYAFSNIEGGFTTVAGGTDILFLGYNGGIKTITYTSISGNTNNPTDITTSLEDFNTTNISSTNVTYLHSTDNNLVVCTNSGVDYFTLSSNPFIHSQTILSGARKAFATSNNIYYTVSGTNTYSLNRLDMCLTDWIEPNYQYITGSGIFEENIKLTDMFVTEGTAELGGNTIFCTTSSGVYVIDEDSENFAIYYTR